MTTKALIIDDEPDLSELLAITLERMSIECRVAHDVTSALNLLKKDSFQLCLTDMHLPDGSGLDIVQIIQKTILKPLLL